MQMLSTRGDRWLLLAFCALVLGSVTNAWAVKYVWSSEQMACAASLGINPTKAVDPTSPAALRQLAWFADAIVIGTVAGITHEPRSEYHTNVHLTVTSVLKGSTPATIVVKQFSGPAYDEITGQIASRSVAGEATFSVGERVLLFLNSDYPMPPDDPEKFRLPQGAYGLVSFLKFKLQNSEVISSYGQRFNLAFAQSEISLVVSRQLVNCQ